MDKEVASCPTMEADQSPNDDMPDGRTNEEVGEQRKANIRKRMALEKEEKEAKMEVRLKERNIAHITRDEPYFARNYLRSEFVANSRQLPGVDALHPCRPHKTVSARAGDCSEGNGAYEKVLLYLVFF